MSSEFAVVPMAFGMLLGPQILSAIFLATSTRARANSGAFVLGVAAATTIGMVIAYGTAVLFGVATDESQSGDDWLTYLVVALLVGLSPILAIVIGGTRAEQAMPGIREWMRANSWLVSIVVYVFFIYAFLS